MPRGELICSDCGKYESECTCLKEDKMAELREYHKQYYEENKVAILEQ